MKFLRKYNLDLKNSCLLNEALSHSSYAYESNSKTNYERLEFLGDAVLQVVISEYLYSKFQYKEGQMSKLRASYVCEAALDFYSDKVGLKPYIKLGHGQEVNDTIAADVFEAIIAVIYLERGFESAKEYILEIIAPEIDAEKHFFDDFKSLMQEYCHTSKQSIVYNLVNEIGSAHDKTFFVEIVIEGHVYGKGEGKSKKEAEQRAAKDAYSKSIK